MKFGNTNQGTGIQASPVTPFFPLIHTGQSPLSSLVRWITKGQCGHSGRHVHQDCRGLGSSLGAWVRVERRNPAGLGSGWEEGRPPGRPKESKGEETPHPWGSGGQGRRRRDPILLGQREARVRAEKETPEAWGQGGEGGQRNRGGPGSGQERPYTLGAVGTLGVRAGGRDPILLGSERLRVRAGGGETLRLGAQVGEGRPPEA